MGVALKSSHGVDPGRDFPVTCRKGPVQPGLFGELLGMFRKFVAHVISGASIIKVEVDIFAER